MTFNRGKLLRLAKAGKLVRTGSYHFDDCTGEERSDNEIPVKVIKSNSEAVQGICCLREDQFKSKSGCAYVDAHGTVSLIVHSNSNFEFRILP